MKLMKVFSMVLAVHIVALTIFFLSPGCQSNPKPTTPAPVAGAGSDPSVPQNWSNQTSDVYPVPQDTGDTFFGATPAERARSTPTRPTSVSPSVATGPINVSGPVAPATIEYVVQRGDSLWAIARKFNVSQQELQNANPGLGANLQVGQSIQVPRSGSAPASVASAAQPAPVTAAAAAPAGPSTTYTVKSGDSLSRIASRHNTTVAAIRAANGLKSDLIQVGQSLIIPGSGAVSAATPSSSPAPAPTAARPTGGATVVVQAGDTLEVIARRNNVTVADLRAANNNVDPRRLRIGQELVIPGSAAAAQTTATAARPAARPAAAPANQDLDSLLPEDTMDAPVIPLDGDGF
jgi:LysM repeat protein